MYAKRCYFRAKEEEKEKEEEDDDEDDDEEEEEEEEEKVSKEEMYKSRSAKRPRIYLEKHDLREVEMNGTCHVAQIHVQAGEEALPAGR